MDATTQQKRLSTRSTGAPSASSPHRHRLAGGPAHRVLARVGFEAEDAPTAQEDVGRGGPGWGIPVRARHLLALSGLLLGAVLGMPARAQEAPTTAAQELAKNARNPFAEFVKLPVQFTTGFGVGPRHRAGESINVQPVLPLSLSAEWDLIFRPSVTATYLPAPGAQFGLEDLQASLFLTPAEATKWIWGLGPIVQLPTATTDGLGTGRWSAGPTGALIYSSGPWLNGVLTYHLASFAGDRHRSSVNQTYIEPEVSYSFASGWYVQCDPALTYDWTADSADAWSIPMGADIGDALTIGAQAMSFQLGVYDFLKRPDGGPEWLMRAQVTLLFPAGH